MLEVAGGILLALIAIPVLLFAVPVLARLLVPTLLAVGVLVYFISHF